MPTVVIATVNREHGSTGVHTHTRQPAGRAPIAAGDQRVTG